MASGSPQTEPRLMPERFISVADVARLLGMRPSWVYKQVEARKIDAHKFGHYLRFDPADVEAYIARHRIETADG